MADSDTSPASPVEEKEHFCESHPNDTSDSAEDIINTIKYKKEDIRQDINQDKNEDINEDVKRDVHYNIPTTAKIDDTDNDVDDDTDNDVHAILDTDDTTDDTDDSEKLSDAQPDSCCEKCTKRVKNLAKKCCSQESFLKYTWKALHLVGVRPLLSFTSKVGSSCCGLHFSDTIFYFKTRQNFLALTIDDAPGLDAETGQKVLELLKEHNVKSTFFIISNNVTRYNQHDFMKRVVADGHELANHMVIDEPAIKYDVKQFERDLLACEYQLSEYVKDFGDYGCTVNPERLRCLSEKTYPDMVLEDRVLTGHKWFRAPSAVQTRKMANILREHNYRSALCDVYPLDVALKSDPDFIGKFCAKHARPGSIICLHMPSKEFRSWNFEALQILLPILTSRFSCVTLSELYVIARNERYYNNSQKGKTKSKCAPCGKTNNTDQ